MFGGVVGGELTAEGVATAAAAAAAATGAVTRGGVGAATAGGSAGGGTVIFGAGAGGGTSVATGCKVFILSRMAALAFSIAAASTAGGALIVAGGTD